MDVDYAKIIAEYTEAPAPGAIIRRISDIPAQKLSWLWPGRFPLGKLTLLAGDPGVGKSFVTLDIAARVTRGTAWPDGVSNTQPGSVIILSAEDDAADTIRPRLEAAGANLDKVHILQAVRRIGEDGRAILDLFSLQTDVTALQDAAVSLDDVRLVIIDPVSAYLGSTDSHVNSKVRGLLAPLAELAQTLRIAVLLIDHLSKSNRQALYRPNGSIAFTAAARAVWFFAKNPDDPIQRLMLPGKLNLAPGQTGLSYSLRTGESHAVTVAWGEAVTMTADSVLQPEDVEERSERLEATDWLRDHLSKGPVSAKQIREESNAAGLSWRTLQRAKGALGVVSHKGAFEDGWYWELSEGCQDTPKDATSKAWHSSPKLASFDGEGPPCPDGYTPDAEGPGCTCRTCSGWFGSLGGYNAHIARGRCTPAEATA